MEAEMITECGIRVTKTPISNEYICYGSVADRGKNKEYLFKIKERDITRAILIATEYVLETVPIGKKIKVYHQNYVGTDAIFSPYMLEVKNKDLLEKLQYQVITCQKRLEFIDCSVIRELKDKQHKMSRRIRELKKTEIADIVQDDAPIYNKNNIAVKEVSLYIRNNFHPVTNINTGIGILKYKENEREIVSKSEGCNNTQGLLNVAIESVERLKTPCQITVYSSSNLGMAKYIEYGDSVNADELRKLYNLIASNNHSLKIIQSKERQKELQTKLKKLLN